MSLSQRKVFADSILAKKDILWILTNKKLFADLVQKGLPPLEVISVKDYPTDKLKARFLNPATRGTSLNTRMRVRVK
jgi:hypothetical protein